MTDPCVDQPYLYSTVKQRCGWTLNVSILDCFDAFVAYLKKKTSIKHIANKQPMNSRYCIDYVVHQTIIYSFSFISHTWFDISLYINEQNTHAQY